jgi:hypothetical protein
MDRVEVCPAGLALVQEVSAVLQHRKGAALIIDYGAQLTFVPLRLTACGVAQPESDLPVINTCCFLAGSQVQTGHIVTRCKLSVATGFILS